jgi:hypothetical protein
MSAPFTAATVAGIDIISHDEPGPDWPDGATVKLTAIAGAEIDGDGSGPSHGDPDFDPDTTLHDAEGNALNADVVPWCVVPPAVRDCTPGIVLGCQARLRNLRTGAVIDAVVADVGPSRKLGEISIAAAAALGIDSSPTTGGTSEMIVHYAIWPGVPAIVNGVQYALLAV